MNDGFRTLERVLNPGEYTIVYQHAENAITFEDTGVKFIYTEGGKDFEIDYDFESHNVSIREASVITPSLNSVGTVEYDSETHTWSFANFSETSSVASAGVTPGEDNTATYSATSAGEYQVTFTAKSGYRYQYVPAGATPGYKEGEGPDDPTTTILSVTYTLTITKAEIVSADFELPKTNGIIPDPRADTRPKSPQRRRAWERRPPQPFYRGCGRHAGNIQMAVSEYKQRRGDRGYATAAGEYEVWLVISGFANYEDYTTTKRRSP